MAEFQFDSVLMKMIFSVLVPVIGIPLYEVAYTAMNDSFGIGDNNWAVTIFTVIYVLVFALVPISLLRSIIANK